MAWSQTLEAYDLLDSAHAGGERVAEAIRSRGAECLVVRGRSTGGDAGTLGQEPRA